jgi:hypothetical protein
MSWPAIAALLVLATAAISANLISLTIISKINARMPENRRKTFGFWERKVRSDFRRLYPDSNLVRLLDVSVVMMALSFYALVKFWVLAK